MQRQGSFEEASVFPFATRGRGDGSLLSTSREAFLDGDGQGGMRADLHPHVHSKIRQGIHRRNKLHRLPNAATPMGGDAIFTSMTLTTHRAEERHRFHPRREVRQFLGESVCRWLHHRMVEGMIHADETGEHIFGFQFNPNGFQGELGTGKRQGFRPIVGGDADGAIMPGQECKRFFF